MVKPLNKEWELFGRRYRVQGAKGDKVDCNACQKQVSAAVNRLQSHLRVCPARATLPVSLLGLHHQPSQPHQLAPTAPRADANVGAALGDPAVSLGDSTALNEAALTAGDAGLAATMASSSSSSSSSTTAIATANAVVHAASTAVIAGLYTDAPPPNKKPRLSPNRATRDRAARLSPSTSIDDLLLSGLSPPPPLVAANSAAYAKKRLEIEEKRLELELKRDRREARREQLQLEILEAQARKEKMLAEKEAYEAKVLLALSRKQLRDQGVSQEEIDRILPVAPVDEAGALAASDSSASQRATATSASETMMTTPTDVATDLTPSAGAMTVPTLSPGEDDGQTASESEDTPESAADGAIVRQENAPRKDFSLADRPPDAAEC